MSEVERIVDQLKRAGTRAARVEGYQTAEWILVDYGDFVVHVFSEKARKFYELERLWKSAKRLEASEWKTAGKAPRVRKKKLA